MVEAVQGSVKVVLEDIGEGINGDYNPDDPNDVSLCRFTVYRHYAPGERMEPYFLDDETEGGGWRAVADGSYCTQIPTTLPLEQLRGMAEYILSQIQDAIQNQQRCKRLMERLSWLTGDDNFDMKNGKV